MLQNMGHTKHSILQNHISKIRRLMMDPIMKDEKKSYNEVIALTVLVLTVSKACDHTA